MTTAPVPASGLQNVTDRWWNRPRTLAAQLLAEDELTDTAIAERVNKSRKWLHEFKNLPHVQERIFEIRKAIADEVLKYGIALRGNRIKDAQLRRDLLVQVQEARARGETGYDTGIVTKQYKLLGSGENATIVEEYKVDTAFLAEWRANDAYVAEQLGQVEQQAKGGDTYNIDKAILVRYVEGPSS